MCLYAALLTYGGYMFPSWVPSQTSGWKQEVATCKADTHTHTHTHTRWCFTFEYRVDEGAETADSGHGHRGAQHWQHDGGPLRGTSPGGGGGGGRPPSVSLPRHGCPPRAHRVILGRPSVRLLGRIWATVTLSQAVPVRRAPRHPAALETESCRWRTMGQPVCSHTRVQVPVPLEFRVVLPGTAVGGTRSRRTSAHKIVPRAAPSV